MTIPLTFHICFPGIDVEGPFKIPPSFSSHAMKGLGPLISNLAY